MPEATKCVHLVDFDNVEILHKKRHKHELRVGCKKCKGAVTLGDVLKSLALQVSNLNAVVFAPEVQKEGSDGEPVPDSGS